MGFQCKARGIMSKEISTLARKSRQYYLLFSFPIQLTAIIAACLLPVNWVNVLLFYVLVYWLGIQAGSHKLFSHRSWEPRYKWMRYAIAYISCFGLMSGPVSWSTMHRWHHAHSDTDQDPHTPKHGLFHSYIGWLFNPPAVSAVMAKDLLRDKNIVYIDRYCQQLVVVTLLALCLINLELAVAMGLAMTMTFQFEMAVNCFLHKSTNGEWAAANNTWLAIPTGGSSLHANHHEFPGRYSFSKYWYEVDLSALIIKILKK